MTESSPAPGPQSLGGALSSSHQHAGGFGRRPVAAPEIDPEADTVITKSPATPEPPAPTPE